MKIPGKTTQILKRSPVITIDLLDHDGELMEGNRFRLPHPYRHRGDDVFMILPFLSGSGESTTMTYVGIDKESAEFSYSFDVSADEMAEVGNVKLQVSMP